MLGVLWVVACAPVVVDVDGDDLALSVTPAAVELGPVFAGRTVDTETLTVRNDGDVDAELRVTITGEGRAAFAVGADGAVPAGGEVSLSLLFAPTEWGRFTAELAVAGAESVRIVGIAQEDADDDGHGSEASGGDDCDDGDPAVWPGAEEVWYDGVDQDCADDDDDDRDRDGVPYAQDCDDADPSIGAPAEETWNGLDDDCDGAVDDLSAETGATGVLLGASGGAALGRAGTLALGGDVDGDGATDLVVLDEDEDGTAWVVAASAASGGPQGVDRVASGSIAASRGPALVAISPLLDEDGDGVMDVLVGGWDLGEEEGKAWLLSGGQGLDGASTLSARATATFEGNSSQDTLGPAVLADVDGDGLADVATGAPNDQYYREWSFPISRTGNVTVFLGGDLHGALDLDDGALQVHGAGEDDRLGARVTAGDLDGDGYADLLAGAPGVDDGATDGGAVYVFAGAAELDWDDTADGAARAVLLGDERSLALGGDALASPTDLDGDRRLEVVLTAEGAGRVGVWWAAGTWSETASFGSPDLAFSGGFGAGVGAADLDGDGARELLLGAAGDDTAGEDAGALYVFSPVTLGSGAWTSGSAVAVVLGAAAGDGFGAGVSHGADLDGDGREEVLAGAPGVDTSVEDAGAVYLIGE